MTSTSRTSSPSTRVPPVPDGILRLALCVRVRVFESDYQPLAVRVADLRAPSNVGLNLINALACCQGVQRMR
jgi:hypothetical protein